MTQSDGDLRERLKSMNLSVRYMEGIGFVGKKRLGDVISGRDLDQILDLILAERRAAVDGVLDELTQWSADWAESHPNKPFNWYGAVGALKVSKAHQKPYIKFSPEASDEQV